MNSRKMWFKHLMSLINSSTTDLMSIQRSENYVRRDSSSERKMNVSTLSADFSYRFKIIVYKFQVTPWCANEILITKCKRLCRLLSLLNSRICTTKSKVQYKSTFTDLSLCTLACWCKPCNDMYLLYIIIKYIT